MLSHTFVPDEIPLDVVQRIVQAYLRDPAARLTNIQSERLVKADSSSNNSIWRLQLAWSGSEGDGGARWVLKHWRSTEISIEYGVRAPIEALAWQHGLSRPEAMPPGMLSPFVGAELAVNENEAWIMMNDVSEDLQRCASAETPEEVLARTRIILDRLAGFHAHWEQPERLAQLYSYPWLLSQEAQLCRLSRFYRRAFGGAPSAGPYMERLAAYARAFSAWLPPDVRAQWQHHLCDREAILRAFVGLPQTFTHGDIALKNIGLRPQEGGTAIVLIDWEMAGLACPALDAAKAIRAAYGGQAPPRDIWERAFGIAYAQGSLVTFPFYAGMALAQSAEENMRHEYEANIEMLRKWLFD